MARLSVDLRWVESSLLRNQMGLNLRSVAWSALARRRAGVDLVLALVNLGYKETEAHAFRAERGRIDFFSALGRFLLAHTRPVAASEPSASPTR